MQAEQDLQREPTIFNSLLICFLVLILLFIALLSRQDDLALLTILILFLMGASKVWSMVSLSRVSCEIRADKQHLFPGETLSLATIIENAKFLPVWVQVNWPQTRVLGIQADQPVAHQEAGLLWYQQAKFEQDLVALKRGCYRTGPSHLRTSDVFGFFKAEKQQAQRLDIIVYPRIVALKPVYLPKRDLFGTPGSQSPVKDPIYVIGTQDYQPARPARHIHWKASARHLKLQEKVFEPSEQGRVMLVLDVQSFEKSQADDEFEDTLEVVASLCLRLDQMGLAVGFMTNGALIGGRVSSVPTGRGARQLSTILEILARVQMRKQGPMSSVLKQIPGSQHGASWVYFCHQHDKGTAEMQTYCRAGNMPLALFAWDLKSASSDGISSGLSDVHVIPDIRLSDISSTNPGKNDKEPL